LCASRSFTTRPFMAALPLWGFVCGENCGDADSEWELVLEIEKEDGACTFSLSMCSRRRKKIGGRKRGKGCLGGRSMGLLGYTRSDNKINARI
jgi:hypothetical protein